LIMEKQHGISSKRLFSITPTEISSFSSMETEKSRCFQGRNHGRFYIQQTATTSFLPAKAAAAYYGRISPSCGRTGNLTACFNHATRLITHLTRQKFSKKPENKKMGVTPDNYLGEELCESFHVYPCSLPCSSCC
jgi:hypothetical protein